MEATTSVGDTSVRLLQKFLTTILGVQPTLSQQHSPSPLITSIDDIDDLAQALAAAELETFSTVEDDTLHQQPAGAPWFSVEADSDLALEASDDVRSQVQTQAKIFQNPQALAHLTTKSPEVVMNTETMTSLLSPTAKTTEIEHRASASKVFWVQSWGEDTLGITRVGHPSGDPILMLPGIGGHSGLFLGRDHTGLAAFLAEQGFCCYLIDLDGKGICRFRPQALSELESEGPAHDLPAFNDSVFGDYDSVTPDLLDPSSDSVVADADADAAAAGAGGLFKWVTQDLPAVVAWVAEQHPGQRQRWLGHGAAGLVWWALWARYPEFRGECHAIMQVATARTTALATHSKVGNNSSAGNPSADGSERNEKRGPRVSRRTRFSWWLAQQRLGQALLGPRGEVPLRELGLGANNESRSTFNQWLAWCSGEDWVDPVDGFAYAEVIRHAQRQPFCSCWVADQGVCATETGVRALIGSLRLQNPRLFVIKEPFDNVTLLTSPEAVQNHFPTMLNWLNLGRTPRPAAEPASFAIKRGGNRGA